MVQLLEKVAERQKKQDIKLVSIEKRFETLESQTRPVEDSFEADRGLPVTSIEQLIRLEGQLKDHDEYYQLVFIILLLV